MLAVASAVAGAVVAVVAGLVVVNRLDARTPTPGTQGGNSTGGGGAPASNVAAPASRTGGPASAATETGPRQATLTLSVSPARARVQLDRVVLRNWDAPVLVTPGTHRLKVTLDGWQEEEREFVLAEGEQRPLAITLIKEDPPPRTTEDPPRNPDRNPDRTPDRQPDRPQPAWSQSRLKLNLRGEKAVVDRTIRVDPNKTVPFLLYPTPND